MNWLKFVYLISALLAGSLSAIAQTVDYEAEAMGVVSSGDFAPYYIASNRYGTLTQKNDALLRLSAVMPMSLDKRFSYGFGVEALTGYTSEADYARYNSETANFYKNPQNPSSLQLQQLYAEIKFRGVFLTAGMKQREPGLLNFELSSGDLVESGNARPIPQVCAGFVDFQDIPFTNGWVQIQGELSYGKFADNNWMKHHYNYYNYHINLGGLYTYKRVYFRTNTEKPLSVNVGMQSAGLFGGTTSTYRDGERIREVKLKQNFSAFLKMLVPHRESGSAYYDGNTLGSWDVMARYRLADGTELKFYVQKPWEDGSGIGWMNGFDGIWGLEYKSPEPALLSGAVVEYLDFTNQSGPIHWSPDDSPGTTITSNATGGDEYYNNFQTNSYMNYGMSIGSPFLPSPIYNLDGYPAFVHNRVRGFHAGFSGRILPELDYRLLGSYRKAWGDGRIPTSYSAHDTSMMLEAVYRVRKVSGLRLKCQLAFDSGNIYGDSFGVALSVSYNGNFSFK